MLSEQEQNVDNNSNAYQAARDINITNDYIQIKAIFNDLYKINFPELVNEAANRAKENLCSYIDKFTSQLNGLDVVNVQEKLKEPNSQYILNESIVNASRYGNKIDTNLLAMSIKESLLSDDDLLERIFENASLIIPKINRKQLLIILVNFYITVLGFPENIAIPQVLDQMTANIFRGKEDLPVLSEANLTHLVSLGVFTSNHLAGGSGQTFLKQRYPTKYDTVLFPAMQNGQMPVLKSVSDCFTNNKLVKYPIAPTGSAIGFLLAKDSIPELDRNILKNL